MANVIAEKTLISIPRVMPVIQIKKLKIPTLNKKLRIPTSPYRVNFQPRILFIRGVSLKSY